MRRSVLVLLLVAGLAGCLRPPVPPATPSGSPTPVTSPADAPRPGPGSSQPGTPAASTPSVAGAIDVARYEVADFATPSGRIWCGLQASLALCHFPFGDFQGTIPDSERACPGEGLDVTGIEVTSAGSRYFCSGDPSAWPVRGEQRVAWHKNTGFPFVSFDGQTLATLPYGRALKYGRYLCRSETVGVTCANTSTGHGFRVARAGVVLF